MKLPKVMATMRARFAEVDAKARILGGVASIVENTVDIFPGLDSENRATMPLAVWAFLEACRKKRAFAVSIEVEHPDTGELCSWRAEVEA